MASLQADGRRLLAALEGRECRTCEDGTLTRGWYKDNRAALCEACGTPRAQLW